MLSSYVGCHVQTFNWRIGELNRVYCTDDGLSLSSVSDPYWDLLFGLSGLKGGVVGYVSLPGASGRTMKLDELPTEFWNHQLMDLDVDDERSLYRFVEKWGLAISPARNMPSGADEMVLSRMFGRTLEGLCTNPTRKIVDEIHPARERAMKLIGKRVSSQSKARITEPSCPEKEAELLGPYDFEPSKRRDSEEARLRRCLRYWIPGAQVVSLVEVRETLRQMQLCVESIRESVGSRKPVDLGFVNMGLTPTQYIVRGREANHLGPAGFDVKGRSGSDNASVELEADKQTLPYGWNLTAAMCEQIVQAISDEADWKRCSNDNCKIIYKRKQSLRAANPQAVSMYCSDRCYEAVKKRTSRMKQKLSKTQ